MFLALAGALYIMLLVPFYYNYQNSAFHHSVITVNPQKVRVILRSAGRGESNDFVNKRVPKWSPNYPKVVTKLSPSGPQRIPKQSPN